MKRLWRAVEILAWTAFFAFAVLVLGLRFWLLPNIERYRDDIVAAVTRTIGRPVKIGAIEAGWLGLRPQVSFSDVRIYDAEGREALVLPSVDNVLSWRSLLAGTLRLESLVIEGPRLGVRRDAAGALYIAGIKLSDAKGDHRMLDWVLGQDEIVVRNAEIEWQDEKRGAPPLALSALDLRLRNSGDTHSLGISARPPPALGSDLELRAELTGRSAADPAAWSGRVYAELGYTDLAGWRPWVDYPVDMQAGQGALRLWASLGKGQFVQATADVELAGVAARLDKDLPVLELSKMSGRIRALRRAEGFDVTGEKLAVAALRGPAMEPADFRLEWRPAGKAPERGALSATLVELEPLAQLVESLPVPGEIRKRLAELAPRGRLLDATLEWSGKLEEPAKFGAKAKFSELAINARDSFPGVAGLSGSIEATEANGRVQLASRNAQLELPRLLSEPRVLLDMLEGRIDWERQGERALNVKLASLAFGNEDLEGKASGSYTNSGEGPGTIDLEATLKRADGSRVARYLPGAAILGQATHDWLAGAIVEGRASDVRLKLKGDLRDFPFLDPAKGQFQVAARVDKGVLDYVPGWPRISDIDAELLFERDRMEIVARSASVLGAKLANVRVSIPSLLAPPVHLLVEGQADGPTSEFLKFIESSPVQRMIGSFTDGMIAAGRGKLALKLDLPLRNLASTKVEGEFDFAANTLTIPHGGLPPVESAGGRVSFTQSSLALHDLKGRVFGGPVTVSGGTRAGGAIEIVARGDADVATLQPLFDHPWRRHLSGAAPYTATVQVRERRVRVIVESSLRGVSSVLPAPLAKSAADPLPLRVEIHPADASGGERISVTLGALAAGEVQRRREADALAVQRAAVLLMPSGQKVRLPERPGVLIYGSLEVLDVDRWLPFFADGQHADISVALDLKIGTLDAYGKRIHALALRANMEAAGWSAAVQSEEIAGDVSFRGEGGGKLIARLTRLHLPGDYPGAKPQDANRTREWPSVDLVAERFAYKDKELGRIELAAQRDGADWRIDKIALANAEASVSGKGLWRTGEAPQTSINLDLDTSDAGKALARAGYPGLVRGGKAKMQAVLTWAGEPQAIDYPSLTGSLQLQTEDGQFLEINEPGLGKLISLMSLQALPKRLALDFRDVFSKGFQFDRISASGDVERGVMALKDFKMRGSAAEVDMEGEVDLAKETQNLRVRVIPSLGDTAATALVFLNPLLVFPAAIAQKILKDPLGHIFAFNYSVTGTWADPKVAKRAVEARAVEQPAQPAN